MEGCHIDQPSGFNRIHQLLRQRQIEVQGLLDKHMQTTLCTFQADRNMDKGWRTDIDGVQLIFVKQAPIVRVRLRTPLCRSRICMFLSPAEDGHDPGVQFIPGEMLGMGVGHTTSADHADA